MRSEALHREVGGSLTLQVFKNSGDVAPRDVLRVGLDVGNLRGFLQPL